MDMIYIYIYNFFPIFFSIALVLENEEERYIVAYVICESLKLVSNFQKKKKKLVSYKE